MVYAATGTINASDERNKEEIGPIDPRVMRAWSTVDFLQYKFKDAVEIKRGGARWHFGVVAQRVRDAFIAEGLDAFDYGLLCYDEWPEMPEILDDHGAVLQEYRAARSLYGVRYEEALALECAYLRSKI